MPKPLSEHDEEPQKKIQDNDWQPLGRIVEQEAKRMLSEANVVPDPKLVAEGWKRRFIGDARQTKEATELYQQLGFEVHAEPVSAEEMGGDCDDCRVLILLEFKTIYTRPKRA